MNPDIDFVPIFEKYANDPIVREDLKRDQDDFMRQRGLIVTPTIDSFQVQLEDESCLALRKYKQNSDRFVRVQFANDYMSKGFYQL